ncbi:MAG: helix-turn-helix transcriptional regulator [Clostridia bacterium]|nr:helix-turn-helix transcriptional regulator [Clostridia bacterium]
MNLGTKIRELRKMRNLTQEELAEKLNISNQAVSKWENGTCYPDMAQIPVLANFFGVSLDELFCYDVAQLNKKIDAIIDAAKNFFWSAPEKCAEIYLNGLKEYPANERILAELLDVYIQHGTQEKAIPIAEQLVGEAKDLFIQCRAKANLASLYLKADRYEDAKNLIDSLPEMYPYMLCDKMRESSYQLKGEDRLKWAKDWKIIEIQELYIACALEGHGYWETKQYENALVSMEQYRRVLEMFMKSDEIYEDSYLWSGMQTHHWCAYLYAAGCLNKLGRKDEAKEKMERAKYILLHAWVKKDGSANYFAENPERYTDPFREYYSEWELDDLGPCPL